MPHHPLEQPERGNRTLASQLNTERESYNNIPPRPVAPFSPLRALLSLLHTCIVRPSLSIAFPLSRPCASYSYDPHLSPILGLPATKSFARGVLVEHASLAAPLATKDWSLPPLSFTFYSLVGPPRLRVIVEWNSGCKRTRRGRSDPIAVLTFSRAYDNSLVLRLYFLGVLIIIHRRLTQVLRLGLSL